MRLVISSPSAFRNTHLVESLGSIPILISRSLNINRGKNIYVNNIVSIAIGVRKEIFDFNNIPQQTMRKLPMIAEAAIRLLSVYRYFVAKSFTLAFTFVPKWNLIIAFLSTKQLATMIETYITNFKVATIPNNKLPRVRNTELTIDQIIEAFLWLRKKLYTRFRTSLSLGKRANIFLYSWNQFIYFIISINISKSYNIQQQRRVFYVFFN